MLSAEGLSVRKSLSELKHYRKIKVDVIWQLRRMAAFKDIPLTFSTARPFNLRRRRHAVVTGLELITFEIEF